MKTKRITKIYRGVSYFKWPGQHKFLFARGQGTEAGIREYIDRLTPPELAKLVDSSERVMDAVNGDAALVEGRLLEVVDEFVNAAASGGN